MVSLFFFVGQGGTLSAFYRSFRNVRGTPVDVTLINGARSRWCANLQLPNDGDFRTGSRPPTRRTLEREQPAIRAPKELVSYKTSGNHTIYSLGAELKKGEKVFFANHTGLQSYLQGRQIDDACCCDTVTQSALDHVPLDTVGWFETIVD